MGKFEGANGGDWTNTCLEAWFIGTFEGAEGGG